MATIRGLGTDCRVPFTLYVKGYRYAEIARMMHIPLGTVKSRIFFARRKLREELQDFRADA